MDGENERKGEGSSLYNVGVDGSSVIADSHAGENKMEDPKSECIVKQTPHTHQHDPSIYV